MSDPIEIVVDNKLRILLDSISKKVARELRESFEHRNPEYYKLKSMGYSVYKKPAVIKTWNHEKDSDGDWWLCLPRGGMQRIRDIFDLHNIDWIASDERSEGEYLGAYVGDWVSGDLFPEQNLVLWNHQVRIVKAIEKIENCIVRAPTGSGKSSAIINAITRLQRPTIVIVWSTALLNQWLDRINQELGVDKKEIGIIQGSKCRVRPITLAMQQTLNRYSSDQWKKIKDVFGFVACDEVQRYAAATFTKTIDQFSARYRIGVSADERRKDKKEFLIYDMFGKVAEDIKKKELVNKNLIHDVEVRVMPTEFRADWYRDQSIRSDQNPNFTKLTEEMIVDKPRNEIIRQTISQLAKKKYRILVFSQRVEHCKHLDTLTTASGYKSGLLIGGIDYRDLFEATKQGLIEGTRQVGIGTLSGGSSVGLDLPQVSHGILTTPIHNNKQFMNQVTGRLCRIAEDKSIAQIYILWDKYIFGKRPLLNFRRWYSTVKVWDGEQWKDVNAFLKEYIDHEEKKRYQEEFGGDSPFISAQAIREKA